MQYHLLTYIGRFQPFHNGHKAVIDEALQHAGRVAIVIGSHDKPRDTRDPWTSSERAHMIAGCFTPEEQKRLVFVPQADHLYNFERWLGGVESSVYSTAFSKWQPGKYDIGIIGVNKDWTSFYLNHFPQWDRMEFTPEPMINATDIRHDYFTLSEKNRVADEVLPEFTASYLRAWASTDHFLDIRDEYAFIRKYRTRFGPGPFITGDMLVMQAGNILLIERGKEYGAGLLALPGGFVAPNETIIDGAIRELYEETKIGVDRETLRGAIRRQRVFDAPGRSQRGRIITTCYMAKLYGEELPDIKGSDDAAKAMWVSPGTLRRDQVFEDHYDIIETMTGMTDNT